MHGRFFYRDAFIKTIFFAVAIFSTLLFFSCKKKDVAIVFDNSEPLALAPDIEWAVVMEPYAAFRKSADWEAATEGHCRKGDVLQVKGKSFSGTETWYEFANGWVHSSALTIYSNKYKADTAASRM